MKILIVLPNLKFGGVEKMRLFLARDWIKKGHEVEVVVLRKEGELVSLFESIDIPIRIHELCVDRISFALFPLARCLRKYNPDIVLSAMWPLTSLTVISWLFAGRPGRLFLSEHTQLSVARNMELRSSTFFIKATIFASYRFAHGLIAVSQGVKNDLIKSFKLPKDWIRVIYNPAGSSGSQNEEESLLYKENLKYKFIILTVGELKDQKKHDLLIKAFNKIPSKSQCMLYIVGEGKQRDSLERLIRELGLEDRVFLPGFTLDVARWYRCADLFVLSSGWEGFGNVIVEALSYGVPVVSTDCPSGPSEILMDGYFGKLVPCGNVQALANAIESSLHESHDINMLIDRSKNFSVEQISNQYLDYFQVSNNV
jgi:glycosyltransferase involved in cell wall biosynthesis